ncbi:MAG: hypothetical protein WCD76_16945, partial [Pyrinomonadaceae bacterium]
MSSTQTVTTQNRAGTKLQAKRARVDVALLRALTIHTHSEERWEQLQLRGATDAQIYHALKAEFGTGGGSQTDDKIQFAYTGEGEPRFWIDTSTSYTSAKPTLQGNALVKRVREVLTIPQPVSIAAEASPETARVDDSDAPDDESSLEATFARRGANEFGVYVKGVKKERVTYKGGFVELRIVRDPLDLKLRAEYQSTGPILGSGYSSPVTVRGTQYETLEEARGAQYLNARKGLVSLRERADSDARRAQVNAAISKLDKW